MKKTLINMGYSALVGTVLSLPLTGWGSLAAFENSKIESKEYRDIDNSTIEVHALRDGGVRVMDRGIRFGSSYLVDSDGDGKLDYRNNHAGGVNFASGIGRTKPTEADSNLYVRIMGQ